MEQAKQPGGPVKADATMAGGLKRTWQRITKMDEIGVIGALLVLAVLLSVSTDSFFTPTNILQVARQASYFGIMAVAMVFVMSMGDIDLSVGSIFMLTNIVA